MGYPAATYTSFIVRKQKDTLKIKADHVRGGFETLGVFGLFLFPLLLLYLYAPPGNVKGIIFVLSFPVAYLLMWKFESYVLGVPIIDVNTKTKKLKELGLNKFQVEIADIKKIAVVEEMHGEGELENKLYRLRYELPDGDKTSDFAFTSFDKAEGVLKVINSTIEEK